MGEQMTGTVVEIGRLAGFASPELRGLFEEWLRALEQEVLTLLRERGGCDPATLAQQLNLSAESVIFLVAKLVREGKVQITEIKLAA